MPVPEDLLAIMACPACRGSLIDDDTHLRCSSCGLRYPVEQGIPVMLPEAALPPAEDGGS